VSDLATFQRAFATAIVDPAARHELAARPGFSVYRNTCAFGALDALRAAYPTVAMLLGGMRFDRVALDFSRRHPPSSPVLAEYGEGFADHLEDQPWIRELPYLPDVARLDRLRLESHGAPDATALAGSELAGVDADAWMTLRLGLHPAARFAWLSTPAMTIWLAHSDGEPGESLAPEWQAEGALFTRPGSAVSAVMIDRPEHRLLFGLRLGETIGEAAAAVVATYPDTELSRLFARLIELGAFLSLETQRNG
jgi:Putative DNA-binding domain